MRKCPRCGQQLILLRHELIAWRENLQIYQTGDEWGCSTKGCGYNEKREWFVERAKPEPEGFETSWTYNRMKDEFDAWHPFPIRAEPV